ncbi:MAG: VWA domain-containing protein [Clostridiales bacterium]|nr:VWA domain-containing protein [Clostridiales bacterium]
MKKIKAVSLLLSLSLLASLAIPGALTLPTQAVGEQEDKGMVINKTAKANDDGTYTITLEAYATGSKIITETKKDIPTDIVLVLDQSGSMAESMSSEQAYSAYENRNNRYLRGERFNGGAGNLYYPLDGGYVEVQVDREEVNGYEPLDADTSNRTYYDDRNNLYIKDADGDYQEVTVERGFQGGRFVYTYSVNGQQITQSSGRDESPNFGTYGPIYRAGNVYQYTYYYQLQGQGRVDIETSLGENTIPSKTYYRYGTVNTSRLEALESAVTTFANSVVTKAAGPDGTLGNDDDVNHRVAVVGFASKDGYGNNTELLSISGQNSGSVGVEYDSITDRNLVDVLQDMDTTAGQSMVQSAIDALAAEGATRADLGMDMANRILNANPVPEGEKRARVVVFFTDGSPTSFSSYDENVAKAAISNAFSIKTDGAVVYSVGVFPGADATNNGIDKNNASRQENQFMQDVSSNNGMPQNPSYYLSASDADTLNSIFQQISDNIESGGASTTLGKETVIKDIIAPQFELPEGTTATNIILETYSYTGENRWEKNDGPMGATAAVDGDKVDVAGFDFCENYVGTVTENGNVTYRGDKLVITFTVKPKDGFLGGNNVYTNTSAGVYENSTAEDPVLTFDRPQVNVPIKDVTVTAQDKNVYLLNDLTAEELRTGATAKVGNVSLDLTKPDQNYGLELWQTSGVDISVEITDAEGKVISTGLSSLRTDTTYNVKVQVSPKTSALPESSGEAAETKLDTAEAAIKVFKPELTYKDGEVYYGDTVPTDFTANLTSTKWKHNDTEADTATMGAAPKLTLTYTLDATKIEDGKINTKQNVGVDAEVKIGDTVVITDTTFLHTACTGTDCGWNETTLDGTPAFLLHVKTCQLNIVKYGGVQDEPYVFTVYKDNVKYSEVTINGPGTEIIYELPVGTYTIVEDTGWSWRYDATYNGEKVKLTADSPESSITCINKKTENYWLNGFSDVVKNIFGINTK